MRSRRMRLVLLSFLMLFLELVLIRWTAANVLYLALFTNFVLLASFLGIGIGFLRARAGRDLFPLAPLVLAGLVVFVFLFPVRVGNFAAGTLVGHFQLPALPEWLELTVIFLGVTAVMALVAEGVARVFATFEPLEAYRLDIIGSIAGIAVFSLLSFVQAPPVVWGLIVASVIWFLSTGRRMFKGIALGFVVAVFAVQSFLPNTLWSPYYRVTYVGPADDGGVSVRVNNISHQSIHSLETLRASLPLYSVPYEMTAGNPLNDVLIVGAGTGNDVAVALSQGARRVVAVEIDPALVELGRELHPDRPYQDPRVEVHIQDGRAFLEQTEERFDLILFALPDSLTLVTGQAALRLESYLFTIDALDEARRHLRPEGAFSAYNYYLTHVFERYAHTLELIYGHQPCIWQGEALGGRSQWVMTVGEGTSAVSCEFEPVSLAEAPPPATDDYPFPYLAEREIPPRYLIALALILVASLGLVRVASGPLGRMRPYVDLFFMGAAFLLLETKNVVQFALLFGTTWFVNALVFAGILLSVLAAIEVARRRRLPRPPILYAVLLVALAVAWVIPQESLLALPLVPRFAAAVAIAFAPVFLANLIFAQRFKDVGSSLSAFGANLLGAMVGGILEYASLLVGFRALLIAVAVLYGLAFILRPRRAVAA